MLFHGKGTGLNLAIFMEGNGGSTLELYKIGLEGYPDS